MIKSELIANRPLTKSERRDLYSYVDQILSSLPPPALNELLEGYDNDLDALLLSLLQETHNIVHLDTYHIDPESFDYLPHLESAFDESMKILSYNYFKVTMLPNFNMGWRNIEWGNLIQLYRWTSFQCQRGSGKSYEFCFAFPLWRIWSYRPPKYFDRDTADNKNRKEVVLITNESKLGIIHLSKIVEEIRLNELLHEVLLPSGRDSLGREQIRTKNGATIILRSKDSFIRGLHLGTVITDDFLDKSCLYSADQRLKFSDTFYSEICNIVEPGGYNVVSGTPFHEQDLYADIRKDPRFKSFIYPGIYPDGTILAPDRYTYEEIVSQKESQGTIIFTREHLVKPISDQSSLFPWEYLNKARAGMEKVSLTENIESYPIKMERVTLGCDFAISASIGADYSVFLVWGRGYDKKYYLINVWRKQGASHNEQVSQIVSMDSRFRPNVIMAEGNGFQSIMIQLVRERGVSNIEEFITEAHLKKDLYEGLPSLSALFERGEIKIPYGDEKSKNVFDWLCGEFNSITFRGDSGKLESSSEHDDGAMASFFAITDLREKKGTFAVHYI